MAHRFSANSLIHSFIHSFKNFYSASSSPLLLVFVFRRQSITVKKDSVRCPNRRRFPRGHDRGGALTAGGPDCRGPLCFAQPAQQIATPLGWLQVIIKTEFNFITAMHGIRRVLDLIEPTSPPCEQKDQSISLDLIFTAVNPSVQGFIVGRNSVA